MTNFQSEFSTIPDADFTRLADAQGCFEYHPKSCQILIPLATADQLCREQEAIRKAKEEATKAESAKRAAAALAILSKASSVALKVAAAPAAKRRAGFV